MFTVNVQTRWQCCHLDQGGRSLCCNWSINIDIGIDVGTFSTCLQRYVLVASLRSRCVDLPAIQVCAPSCQVEANMFAGVMCIVQDPARTGFFALREPQVQYRGVWSHLPDNWQQSAPTPTRGSNRDSARQCCCALHRYEAHMGQFLQDGKFGCFASYFFLQKVEPSCDQTWKDTFDFSIVPG